MANQVLYGFTNLKDVFTDRVETVGIPTVNTAIDATISEHNRQMDALMALFAQPTTEYQIRYKTPQAARLQPCGQHLVVVAGETGAASLVDEALLLTGDRDRPSRGGPDSRRQQSAGAQGDGQCSN